MLNNQYLVIYMPQIIQISSIVNKIIKAILNLFLFTNRKNSSIDQWFLKMQGKFKINWHHYPLKRCKCIYVKIQVIDKTL